MNNNYETILPMLDSIKEALADKAKVKLKVIHKLAQKNLVRF
jgi:hypothetical protein